MDTTQDYSTIATNDSPTQPNDEFYNPIYRSFKVGKIVIIDGRKFRVRKITAKDIVLREMQD